MKDVDEAHVQYEPTVRVEGPRRGVPVITTLLYILIVMLSVTAYPERYDSWMDYIQHCGELDGIEALPAFYAANHYLGANGVKILMAALLSLVFTSLIGNITATSRLLFAMGREDMINEKYGRVGRFGTPGRAILLIVITALIIPIIGRTAVGWVVDVTCIGAILIDGIVSACALKKARARNDATEIFTGLIGLALMIFAGLYTFIPNLITTGTIARETYILFIAWSILGFVFFRLLLRHDKSKKYGKSVIVWASLLTLILLISLIWQASMTASTNPWFSPWKSIDCAALSPSIVSDKRDLIFAILKNEAIGSPSSCNAPVVSSIYYSTLNPLDIQ